MDIEAMETAAAAAETATTTTPSTETAVRLQSKEGCEFVVSLSVAMMSGTVANTIRDAEGALTFAIPLPNVTEPVLKQVLAYCEIYVKNPPAEPDKKTDDVPEWEAAFMKDVTPAQLIELVLAADFMHTKPLLDSCCRRVASTIKGKTPEETRAMYGIKNDFSDEELARIKREEDWCDESELATT